MVSPETIPLAGTDRDINMGGLYRLSVRGSSLMEFQKHTAS